MVIAFGAIGREFIQHGLYFLTHGDYQLKLKYHWYTYTLSFSIESAFRARVDISVVKFINHCLIYKLLPVIEEPSIH